MSTLNNLKIISYELEYDKDSMFSIELILIYGIDCERWAIKWGDRNALGKTPDEHGYFHFIHELLPSSRDDDYYLEYRWNTAQDAFDFWGTNRDKIIATSSERRKFFDKTFFDKTRGNNGL